MKLSQFIQTKMEQLLEEWKKDAVEISPHLRGEGSLALEDHARKMLEFIIEDLQTTQTDRESARKALGKGTLPDSIAAEDHGAQRHDQGLSMLQILMELRALRARILQAWGEAGQGLSANDMDDLSRFNEAIDQLIIDSVSSYSARKEQETRQFEAILKASRDPAAIFARDGTVLFANTAMTELANTTVRDAISRTPLELDNSDDKGLHDAITATVTTGQTQRRELHHYLSSGSELYFDCQFVPVFNDQNEIEAVANTSRAITERKKSEHKVWRSANFDSLTGLPSRPLFIDRLEQTLLEADRIGTSFALLFIDLDHFKETNDQLGHEAGDQLLTKVGERISSTIRAMDTAARLGGDEFTVILKETGREGAKEAAKGILDRLKQVFNINSHQVHISSSIGLTVFPDDGTDLDKLLKNADQAMYVAKAHVSQKIQAYEPWMAQSESEHEQLSTELDDALRENQLEIYYQPIVDLRTGAISGAEALLRWNHPHEGLLTPDAFLDVCEKSGMIDRITAFVLQQAATCAFRWRREDDEIFPISINESPISFVTPSLVDKWRERLTHTSVDESWLTLELTSASFEHIRASGFNPVKKLSLPNSPLKLSINDFGIEAFSPSALQEFMIDRVKIDRELTKDAGQGGDADAQLKSIIAMAHAIDLEVVAVGVETDQQLQCLSRAGCDYAQGYLFSEPLPQDDFQALLNRERQQMRAERGPAQHVFSARLHSTGSTPSPRTP